MTHLICPDQYSRRLELYEKLLWHLYNIPFKYHFLMDENRYEDGANLIRHFVGDTEIDYAEAEEGLSWKNLPCSMLEMMVALALRIERTIMVDVNYGDRTGMWFWGMINNLGLSPFINQAFDPVLVNAIVENFLEGNYDEHGNGGLFYVEYPDQPLNQIDIWKQLMWYLHEEREREKECTLTIDRR